MSFKSTPPRIVDVPWLRVGQIKNLTFSTTIRANEWLSIILVVVYFPGSVAFWTLHYKTPSFASLIVSTLLPIHSKPEPLVIKQ
jgi:Fe2+ transport system protein B